VTDYKVGSSQTMNLSSASVSTGKTGSDCMLYSSCLFCRHLLATVRLDIGQDRPSMTPVMSLVTQLAFSSLLNTIFYFILKAPHMTEVVEDYFIFRISVWLKFLLLMPFSAYIMYLHTNTSSKQKLVKVFHSTDYHSENFIWFSSGEESDLTTNRRSAGTISWCFPVQLKYTVSEVSSIRGLSTFLFGS